MTQQRLDQAFPIVAAALGKHLGVRVQVHGNSACTDGNLIILPQLEDPDETLKSVVWGYLAHEAAHVRYTDFNCIAEAQPEGLLRSLFNIIEDVRVEKAIGSDYPGTKISIEKTLQHLIDASSITPKDWMQEPTLTLEGFCLFYLRVKVLDQRLLAPLLDLSREALKCFMDVNTLQHLTKILDTTDQLISTQEALTLAAVISQLLGIENETHAGEAAQDDDGDRQEPQHHGHANPPVDDLRQADLSGLSWNEGPHLEDLFAPIQHQLEQSASVRHGLKLPLADRPQGNDAMGRLQLEEIQLASKALTTSLYGWVQSERMNRRSPSRKGHRIQGRRLTRSLFGDDRFYLKEQRRIQPNTAIHVLLDRSPSMSASIPTDSHPCRRRIELAWEATLALASALELIPGVNPAITAFPGQEGLDERVYEVMAHGERLTECADRFEIGTNGSTPLTEALIYGISRLLITREPRKILLVLTDGIPNDPVEAGEVLKQCAEIGIEVHGIGLGIDIQHLFKSSINIQDLKELQPRLFEWSETILTSC